MVAFSQHLLTDTARAQSHYSAAGTITQNQHVLARISAK
jgi:hypothetical protein